MLDKIEPHLQVHPRPISYTAPNLPRTHPAHNSRSPRAKSKPTRCDCHANEKVASPFPRVRVGFVIPPCTANPYDQRQIRTPVGIAPNRHQQDERQTRIASSENREETSGY